MQRCVISEEMCVTKIIIRLLRPIGVYIIIGHKPQSSITAYDFNYTLHSQNLKFQDKKIGHYNFWNERKAHCLLIHIINNVTEPTIFKLLCLLPQLNSIDMKPKITFTKDIARLGRTKQDMWLIIIIRSHAAENSSLMTYNAWEISWVTRSAERNSPCAATLGRPQI